MGKTRDLLRKISDTMGTFLPLYCISDFSVDYDGYSISSKGFLPTVVDIKRWEPDHLLRKLYSGHEATVELDMEQKIGFK